MGNRFRRFLTGTSRGRFLPWEASEEEPAAATEGEEEVEEGTVELCGDCSVDKCGAGFACKVWEDAGEEEFCEGTDIPLTDGDSFCVAADVVAGSDDVSTAPEGAAGPDN